ncbi:hypothetical protein M427DRAFT_47643 [Gonapodya prolifera JEL478]|uniref:RNI-like protein n=1 Tax=Gonapodya prolifera (strain JEL478) TaxID=1344416 RepID=A0A139A272_GONPJ|nr:hypothetical protein M427DRAFT_47643 [Gonapodya prolifera JEL478]|eukprot:KXS10841.1 hypothetical protein M427DRAFT_47643 [Gonapodya prolifera JEL478]
MSTMVQLVGALRRLKVLSLNNMPIIPDLFGKRTLGSFIAGCTCKLDVHFQQKEDIGVAHWRDEMDMHKWPNTSLAGERVSALTTMKLISALRDVSMNTTHWILKKPPIDLLYGLIWGLESVAAKIKVLDVSNAPAEVHHLIQLLLPKCTELEVLGIHAEGGSFMLPLLLAVSVKRLLESNFGYRVLGIGKLGNLPLSSVLLEGIVANCSSLSILELYGYVDISISAVLRLVDTRTQDLEIHFRWKVLGSVLLRDEMDMSKWPDRKLGGLYTGRVLGISLRKRRMSFGGGRALKLLIGAREGGGARAWLKLLHTNTPDDDLAGSSPILQDMDII